MAKELPYFKFYVSEWNDGDITLEDLETQGLFINICSVYWSKKGQITLTKLKRRFSEVKPTAFDSLINENIIKVLDNDLISISFLDEQIQETVKRSQTNSLNGAKGGRPKKQKETEKKPTALISESETKAKKSNKEEKRREEKREEEDINYLYGLYPTKCPYSDRSTGKGSKNKKQIQTLLNSKSKNELEEAIKFYLEECSRTKTWLKNFQSCLNNLPEVLKREKVIFWRKTFENVDLYHETPANVFYERYKTEEDRKEVVIMQNKPMFGKLIKGL